MFFLIKNISWLAVVVATASYFILGALWFAPFMFGKLWAKAIGFDQPLGWKAPLSYYVGPFIGCFVASLVTAMLINALRIESYAVASSLGLVLGVGYAASVSFVNALSPKTPQPFLYGAVTGAYHTAGIIIAALVVVLVQ